MESEVLQRNPSFSESEENLLEIIRNGPYISSPPPLPDDSSDSESDTSSECMFNEAFEISLEDYFQPVSIDYRSSEYPTRSLNTIIEEDEDEYLEQEAKTQNQFGQEVDFTTPEMETEIKQRESVSSNSSDRPGKIKNSTALDSLFADLDQDLELQYEEEEFEFFLMETQCIAEEIIEEAVTGALSELYIEIEDKLRLEKEKEAENEISEENLLKPSELLKKQRVSLKNVKDEAKNEKKEDEIHSQVINQPENNERLSPVEIENSTNQTKNLNSNQNYTQKDMELNEQVPAKPPRTSTSSEIIPQKKSIDSPEVKQIAEEATMATEETEEEVEEKPNVQRLPLKSDSSGNEQPKNYALRKSKSREIIRIPRASSKMDVSAEETKSDGKQAEPMSSAKNEEIKAEETETEKVQIELKEEETPKIEIKTEVDSEIEPKNVENNETKPDIPTPAPRKTSPKEEEIEDTIDVPKRNDDIRKSKKMTRKKPNYRDSVWRNISCLATEIDELEKDQTQQKESSKKSKNSYCNIQ